MKDKTLATIAIITTLVGLAILLVLSSSITLEETKIHDIGENGEEVRIRGIITKVTNTNKTVILEISQPASLNAVFFKKSDEERFKEGSFIEAEGYVEEYKGKKQLIIEEVKQ